MPQWHHDHSSTALDHQKASAAPDGSPKARGLHSHLRERVRAISTITVTMVVIALFGYGLTFVPKTEVSGFDFTAYREKVARKPETMRTIIAREMGADGLTQDGVAGWVDYEAGTGSLVMSIRDQHGNPVEGAAVRAVLQRPDGPEGPNFMLTPDKDKRYSADVRSFGSGQWNVTVTAVDPGSHDESGLIFLLEKSIDID